jgi:hypothetical protein
MACHVLTSRGTLLEGIALWGELKPLLTATGADHKRALAYCDWAVAKGLLAIRTHVDVCDARLLAVDALLEVKQPGGALYRLATGRVSAGRLVASTRCTGQPETCTGQGRRCGGRHSAF